MRSKPATQYIAWRNRMRTQHPNLWHPIRFAIMLIVLAWTIYGVCYEPPTDIFGVIWVAILVLRRFEAFLRCFFAPTQRPTKQ